MPLTANKAAEMWASMRAWLRTGAIPDDPELKAELTGREYGFDLHNAIRLEKKEDMKKRGLASPDNADGLCLTFAYPVADLPDDARSTGAARGRRKRRRQHHPVRLRPARGPVGRPVTLDSHRLQCKVGPTVPRGGREASWETVSTGRPDVWRPAVLIIPD